MTHPHLRLLPLHSLFDNALDRLSLRIVCYAQGQSGDPAMGFPKNCVFAGHSPQACVP